MNPLTLPQPVRCAGPSLLYWPAGRSLERGRGCPQPPSQAGAALPALGGVAALCRALLLAGYRGNIFWALLLAHFTDKETRAQGGVLTQPGVESGESDPRVPALSITGPPPRPPAPTHQTLLSGPRGHPLLCFLPRGMGAREILALCLAGLFPALERGTGQGFADTSALAR